MKLQLPPKGYDLQYEIARNGQIEREDAQNLKRGRDIEVGLARIIIASPDGTRWELTVDNAGTVGATSL